MAASSPADQERVRRHVIASGRVQGVFFRDSTQREARRRGAAGWVRNLGDGTVEAVFEGPPEVVEAMVEFCRRGPEHAQVDGLEIAADQPPEGLIGFAIR
jgi:acylphosphatase